MASTERISGEEDEQRLIEALQRNDRDCLAEIYASYSGIAYGLAVKSLGRTADADDVVQESFLALWRQSQRLDPARGIRSYLLTIVHNKSVDRLRQRGRRNEAELDPALSLIAADSDPQGAASQLSDRDMVRNALVGLPEDQRRAIEMTYFNGLTINEAAQRAGVPIGTIKSRLRLAMGRLRRSLVEAV